MPEAAEARPAIRWPKVVLFGASITEYSFSQDGGWGAILADRLRRKCDVVARGFCGYNTRMCRALLPALFPTFGEHIAALTILLGSNDSTSPEVNSKQHVPLEEYKENLTWMVDYLESQGVDRTKVILISPPMFNSKRWAKFKGLPEPEMDHNPVVEMYAATCILVAQTLGCSFVDLFGLMETKHQDNWNDLLTDGCHFSSEGSQIVAEAVWPLIEERTRELPHILPALDDMDSLDPASSITRWISAASTRQ